jgi:hypothetical protein
LYKAASLLPQDAPQATEVEVGASLLWAADYDSYGARDALEWANLASFPVARKAGVLLGCLISHGKLRLTMPKQLRNVLISASIGGHFQELLKILETSLPTLDASVVDDPSDYTLWKTGLAQLSDVLAESDAESWEKFMTDVSK